MICEKCWAEAYTMWMTTGKPQYECYRELLVQNERKHVMTTPNNTQVHNKIEPTGKCNYCGTICPIDDLDAIEIDDSGKVGLICVTCQAEASKEMSE